MRPRTAVVLGTDKRVGSRQISIRCDLPPAASLVSLQATGASFSKPRMGAPHGSKPTVRLGPLERPLPSHKTAKPGGQSDILLHCCDPAIAERHGTRRPGRSPTKGIRLHGFG
jgi:hypothetical protein